MACLFHGGRNERDQAMRKVRSNKVGYRIHRSGKLGVCLNLSRLCQPRTVVDVGSGFGTLPLYEAFPNAYFILVEPLREYGASIEAILEKHKGEIHYKAVGNEEGWLEINVNKANPQLSSAFHRTELARIATCCRKERCKLRHLTLFFRTLLQRRVRSYCRSIRKEMSCMCWKALSCYYNRWYQDLLMSFSAAVKDSAYCTHSGGGS